MFRISDFGDFDLLGLSSGVMIQARACAPSVHSFRAVLHEITGDGEDHAMPVPPCEAHRGAPPIGVGGVLRRRHRSPRAQSHFALSPASLKKRPQAALGVRCSDSALRA